MKDAFTGTGESHFPVRETTPTTIRMLQQYEKKFNLTIQTMLNTALELSGAKLQLGI